MHVLKTRYSGFLFLAAILLTTVIACDQSPTFPKPLGYFRIDLPAREFQRFDTTFPFSFNYPKYAQITFDNFTADNPYWMNIDYPNFKGTIHISYKSLVNHSLYQLQEDSRELVFRHAQKAVGIREADYTDEQRRVFAKSYTISGKDVASPYQFYITDSTNHFLRGALYFNVKPNNDSLNPVINFIVQDIRFLIETLSWD